MTMIPISAVTEGTLVGQGVFDVLMRASKEHLDAEFTKGRIRGPEYTTVYLGQVQACMQQALAFIAQRERINLEAQLLEKQILLTTEQAANEVLQGKVLIAQECLLRSQYDASQATVLKTNSETDLLKQKIATEKAQIMELGVDDNSMIGKQKTLYQAQTDGFKRDAEQKATKLWVDSWNARRMTDDGTVADGTNKLDDTTGGRLMTKLLAGIGA